MYTFESRVRYSEMDENKKLALVGFLDYFQDCTTFHSEALGRGVDTIEQLQKIWVLAANQIIVYRYPKLGEYIKVCTWPYEFKGFYGGRNFQMVTREGEILAVCNSQWAFIDRVSGKPCRVDPEEISVYQLEDKLDMEYAPRKIPMPKEGKHMETFLVKRHHLDTNHHVNNAQYVRMAQDYLPEGFLVEQMRAEYKKQAVLGDVIVPVIEEAEGICTVALCDEAERAYAIVEFKRAK